MYFKIKFKNSSHLVLRLILYHVPHVQYYALEPADVCYDKWHNRTGHKITPTTIASLEPVWPGLGRATPTRLLSRNTYVGMKISFQNMIRYKMRVRDDLKLGNWNSFGASNELPALGRVATTMVDYQQMRARLEGWYLLLPFGNYLYAGT